MEAPPAVAAAEAVVAVTEKEGAEVAVARVADAVKADVAGDAVVGAEAVVAAVTVAVKVLASTLRRSEKTINQDNDPLRDYLRREGSKSY